MLIVTLKNRRIGQQKPNISKSTSGLLFWFNMQIDNNVLHFRDQAQSKCGSLDYINHVPRGGDKKVLLNTDD